MRWIRDGRGEIETIVVRPGEERWFAPENLARLSTLFATPVPPAERHSRAELVSAANAYFTAVETEGTAAFAQAPFAPGMNRIENGLQTTNVTDNPRSDRHRWSAAERCARSAPSCAAYRKARARVGPRRYKTFSHSIIFEPLNRLFCLAFCALHRTDTVRHTVATNRTRDTA